MMFRYLVAAVLLQHLVVGENEFDQFGIHRSFTFGDGVYDIWSLRTDWYTARKVCKMQGGDLISIETSEENDAIKAAISDLSGESFWTSGSELEKTVFYWDATGAQIESSSFTDWGVDEPGVNNEECVLLNSSSAHSWADADCLLFEGFFICETHPCPDTDALYEQENQQEKPILRFTFENGTYEISDTAKSWVDAKNSCKVKGMQLVSIETSEENRAILNAISSMKTETFWTSGCDLGDENNYYWEATGQAMASFDYWATGAPSSGNSGHCLCLWDHEGHKWYDLTCTREYLYICELQLCL